MIGALQPASSIRFLISGTAAAASGTFTVQRTISDPASASSSVCFSVVCNVRRIRVGHGLHDDGRASAHAYVSHLHAIRLAARMPARRRVKSFNLCKHSLQF